MQPVRIIALSGLALAILGLANGLVMLTLPSFWYAETPGVAETGPLNVHFIRDIGLAYLAASLAMWFGIRRKDALLLALSAIFSAGHAATHLIDHGVGHGAHGVAAIAGEFIGIYLPAAITLLLALIWINRPKEA